MGYLLPKQENAIFYLKDKVTTEVLFGGAAGPGKSTLGCLWLMEMCQKYPGSRWLMGRSKLKALKETTLNTFFEQAALFKISHQFNYNENSGIIKWNNGSEILLKDLFLYPSDPNFDSLGSLEITGAFIDECNQVVYKAWQMVISRIRYKLNEFGLIPKILGTCNPAKNWVYKEFYKPWRDKTLSVFRRFIPSLPKDNPFLPPTYIDALLRLDKNSRERLYYGNWEYDDDPATLIHLDAIVNYFNPRHIKAEGQKFLTIDVARKGKDKTVFRVWHGWLCIKRFEFAKNSIPEVVNKAKELMRDFSIPVSNCIADEDGVGGGVVDYLNCKGFVNNSSALNDENYENLKSQCSYRMAQKICENEVGELCDSSTVQELVTEEMEQVKAKNIDKDGKPGVLGKDIVSQNLGRSPDDWDSIMMRYWFALQKSFRTRIVASR